MLLNVITKIKHGPYDIYYQTSALYYKYSHDHFRPKLPFPYVQCLWCRKVNCSLSSKRTSPVAL